MSLLDDLRSELSAFDGKAISILSEITARHGDERNFLNNIIKLCGDNEPVIAEGASWILKAHFDAKNSISPKQTAAFVNAAISTQSWATQLHCCQIIGRLNLSKEQAARLAAWLEPLLAHKRPFVRAWSLDALTSLVRADEGLKPRARTALKNAAGDSAASVRARARNIQLS